MCNTMENMPRRFHEHKLQIKPFYIDKYPVTNQEVKQFLDATNYHPKDDLNFYTIGTKEPIPKVGPISP